MEVMYTKRFLRDLRCVPKGVSDAIPALVATCKGVHKLGEIPDLKKVKGVSCAYRIRMGSYRLGFTLRGNILEFSRVGHRRDFYRYFP
jgi:mRNA-degrading endonuclease RelE of RelBE toxin-antitoxin system